MRKPAFPSSSLSLSDLFFFFSYFILFFYSQYRDAIALGVDGVVTDYPGNFIAVRDSNSTASA